MSNRIGRRALPVRYSPRPVRAARRALRHSPSLRASVHAAFWPAVACGGLVLGLLVAVLTRGQFVTWGGFEAIPTAGVR